MVWAPRPSLLWAQGTGGEPAGFVDRRGLARRADQGADSSWPPLFCVVHPGSLSNLQPFRGRLPSSPGEGEGAAGRSECEMGAICS